MGIATHNQFGARIREARMEAKISLRAAAKKMGISAAYLSNLELNVDGSVPSDDVLKRISKLTGVAYGELHELSRYITPDLKAFRKKASPTDAAVIQSFYKYTVDKGITPKKGLDIYKKALEGLK